MTYKVAIVGPPGVITGLSALGVVPFEAHTSQDVYTVLSEIVRKTNNDSEEEKYAVVIVIEDLLTGLSEKEYRQISKNVLPSIVAIPGMKGSQGYMTKRLREYTIRAIGSDIM